MRNLKMRLTGAAAGLALLALVLGWFGPTMLEGVSEQVRTAYLGLAVLVFVGLCGVVFHGMLERAFKPVVALTDHFVRMRAGDLNPRLPEEGPDEMQHLSHTFNEMMEELELQIREVTEEKYAAERGRQYLQEQVEACLRFKELADAAPVGMVLADTDLNVVYQNSTSEAGFLQLSAHLPWNTEVVVGRPLPFLYPDQDQAGRHLASPDNLPYETSQILGPFRIRYLAGAVYGSDGDYAGPVLLWEMHQEESLTEAEEIPLVETAAADAEPDRAEILSQEGEDPPHGDVTPQLQRSAGLVGRGLRMVLDRLGTVTSMVEALRNEEENLRGTLEEMQRRTQSAALLTMERSESLWELVDESKAVGERSSVAASVVKRLRKGLVDADAIPSSVAKLADAIEMMAMQARVEMGRSGEGSGGLQAVVDEVKRLGRDASRLGSDVEGRIERVREEVDEALSLLEEDRHQARAAGRVARRAEAALHRIEQDLSEVNERTSLVAEMADGQSEIGGQISTQLGGISELVEMAARVSRDQARLVNGGSPASPGANGDQTGGEG